MENKHTRAELSMYRSLSLSSKISMTRTRIKGWVNEYGEDGVYVSFSGGKDSTVLLDIVRNECGYKNIPAVFVDVPTQFPELKSFVLTFENIVIVKPSLSFVEVCEKYGFPLISKEVCENVYGAKKYYEKIKDEFGDLSKDQLAEILNRRLLNKEGGSNQRLAIMLGMFTNDKLHPIKSNPGPEEKSRFSYERYKFLIDAPFDVSNKCCYFLKKKPAYDYHKKTGRNPITAQMASESRLRLQKWIEHGCNQFDLKEPISNPMSFWTEQDVLQYIHEKSLPICSVYGDVVKNKFGVYETTGCKRTGCMTCGFGCMMEKPGQGRFEMLKVSHPGMYRLIDIVKNNGVTFREAIEYVNEKGGFDIRL